jgi:hypothetical protein
MPQQGHSGHFPDSSVQNPSANKRSFWQQRVQLSTDTNGSSTAIPKKEGRAKLSSHSL